jgi:hypothetical protein
LQDVGRNIGESLSGLSGYFPSGGASRYQPSSDFGNSTVISSSFKATTSNVFTVRVSSGQVSFHWRLVSYDTFQSTGWSVGQSRQDQVIAGGTVDSGTADVVDTSTPGRSQVSLTVHVQDNSLKHVVVANEPDSVNVDTQRAVIGAGSTSPNVAFLSTGATDYVVSALVPNIDPAGFGLTESRLQQAGIKYPPGLLERFTQGAGLVGSGGRTLLNQIMAWARTQGNAFSNEYDAAKAIQDYLQSTRFTYTTDITADVTKCAGLSTVDCFALIKRGFCEQYATTMTMLMRMAGYPARYVVGYLPGTIAQNTLIWQVTSQQKHAWVEVYFPSFGWIPFDPTGGSIGQPTILPRGSPGPSTVIPSAATVPFATSSGSSNANAGGGSSSSGGSSLPGGLLIPSAVGGFGALALILLWFRRPTRLERPDIVYRNVVKMASRLGYRPRPTQTVYEYTGMLAEIVPRARDPLGVVATAAVEATYGRRQLGTARLISLSAAHRLVRQALLRLAFRWPRRRGPKPQSGGPGATGGSATVRRL